MGFDQIIARFFHFGKFDQISSDDRGSLRIAHDQPSVVTPAGPARNVQSVYVRFIALSIRYDSSRISGVYPYP
jgi:hypothetical protein